MKKHKVMKMIKQNKLYFIRYWLAAVILFMCVNAYAQETMQFDSEAKKLEFVRQMLLKEKYLRPSKGSSEPHCELMMKDFLAGESFKAIEPDVRADSADDPHLAKWKKCEEETISPHGFHWLSDRGGPPYRYYKIELDENKENGPEDILYYNMSKDIPRSTTGYVWVDGCERKRTFAIIGALQNWSDKPNAVYLNALVYYKDQLWAMQFIDGQSLKLSRWLDNRQQGCLSFIFESEEEAKKFYKLYPAK
jgi:hypothetical protein